MNGLFKFIMMVIVFIYLQLVAGNFVKRSPAKVNKPLNKLITSQRRSASNGYVDFGAHTGLKGSYGWYADFPANKN